MEQFSPDELLRLVGRGDDAPLTAIPGHLTHAEKVALRRARIDAIDRAQAAESTTVTRPSEAQVRGFARTRAPAKSKLPRAPGDDEKATQPWLREHLSNLYRIGPVWTVTEARAGYPRHVWRAAVAGVLTYNRDEMRGPEWAIAKLAKALASGEIDDPRGDKQFRTWNNWPKSLYLFALVDLPDRYRGSHANH